MKKIKTIILFVFCLSFIITPLSVKVDAKTIRKEKRYIIVYDSNISNSIKDNIKVDIKSLNIASAELTANEVKKISKDKKIEKIIEDPIVKINNDDSISAEFYEWGTEAVWANKAFDKKITGKGVKVAVLDTGIDIHHPDLKVYGGKSFVDYTNSYDDDNGHGTHVAGIIGALKNNIGLVGVAPESQLYAVKALDYTGSGYLSDIIAGIEWCISNKINIINMSLGVSPYQFPKEAKQMFEDVINRAYSKGILIVASAGNDGANYINYPATFKNVIAVGAVELSYNYQRKRTEFIRTDFSNYGNKVEVSAPGQYIFSTIPLEKEYNIDEIQGYGFMSGTSMSAGYVSGMLALLKQKYPTQKHTFIREKLKTNSIDLGPKGKDIYYGYGMVRFRE